MFKIKLSQFITFSVLPITVLSVQYESTFPIGNTTFWWFIQALILIAFWKASYTFRDSQNIQALQVIKWYLIWNFFCIIRGLLIAETYWDWKGLAGNSMALMLPIVAYTATNILKTQSILTFYIKYAFPLFIFFAFIISTDVYGFYLIPISLLMIFLPALTNRWKVIVIATSFIVIVSDFGARSNVIRFGVPMVLSLIYYFRFLLSARVYELVHKLLFIAPILLFSLAITGVFNVFNMDEYISKEYIEVKSNNEGEIIEDNLKADTRTFLYVDVLQTAQIYNCWLIGRSPARGNESESFGEEDMSGRGERLGNEVAILNIFTWTGIIGVILYLLVFYRASWLAVNQSNNIFAKILGLFIAFRWLYAWVEDINSFTLNYFILWLMLGLCFSKSFRGLNNKQVTYWVRGIFDKRYSYTYIEAPHIYE